MRKGYLIFLLQILCFVSFSQSETEPNDDFQNASSLIRDEYTFGTIGNGATDPYDFFGIDLPSNGNFYVYIEIFNPGSATARLDVDIYNSLRINNEYVGNMMSRAYILNEGDWTSDYFYLCAQSMDSFYVKLNSLDDLEYYVYWQYVNSYPEDGYNNNTPATPTPFYFDTEKQGTIRYELWGGNTFDTVDYFMSVLPAGSYDSVLLNLRAKNNSCTDGQGIKYWLYKNSTANLFAHGYIGNNPSVNAYQEVSSTIPLSNMAAGDVLLIRFSANVGFGYKFKYYKMGEFTPDLEDNCCTFNAIPMEENEVKTGNVGEYDWNSDEYMDEYDMYRIILPQDGAIKLYVKSRNDQCEDYYNYLGADIFDRDGNMFTGYNLSQWNDPNPCGQIRNDTIKIRGFAADTFYIRLHSIEQVSYNFRYEFLDATVSDSAEAYSSPISTVIPIAEGQVRKGHIRFRKSYSQQDPSDIYQFNMPGDGSITVYMKATYRYDFSGTNNNNNNRLSFITSNFTGRTPNNPPTSTLTPDAVYLDTFTICGLGAGTNYITISSQRAYEYEFYYVVNSAETVPNDPEPNNFFKHAIAIEPDEVRNGRLRYFNDQQGAAVDNFDYYKTITPYTGRLKVYIQATNMTCTTAARITLNMYKDTVTAGLIASRNLNNTTSIPAGTTVYDTVYSCLFNPDTAYFRLEGTQSFRYQFRYEFLADTAAIYDPEPDNSLAQATRIGSGQTHTRLLGKTYSAGVDVNDYFKMVVHGPDTLKLRWHVANIGCVDSRIFRIWIYNRLGQLLHVQGYVLNAVGTLNRGDVREGGYNHIFTGLDTAYLRFEANGEMRYSIYTEPLKPSRWFSISGDSTACEGGEYIYKATNVIDSNVTFHWSLPAGGGTLNATDSIATVTWNANGNRNIQLYLSNTEGASPTLTQNVIVNGVFPTQTPVAYNFARRLSTNSLPPGSTCQWYRNDTLIVGATDSSYYAADAGSFTVRFVNDCGPGPISNAIVFADSALVQTISFPHVADLSMAPNLKVTLQASASSNLPVFYQKISGPGTILNDTLSVTGTGTIIVKAMQPGDDVYAPAADQFDTITVVKGDQLITFDNIPDQILNGISFIIPGSASSGLEVSYTAIAGADLVTINNLSGPLFSITKKGAGTVTLRATQSGNANYNAAAPVERSFCIGVRTLTPIIGEDEPCIATYQYRTQKIPGAIYTWTLSGGGILTTNKDTAWVQWQTPGIYSLKVKATSPCDPIFTDEQEMIIATSNNNPGMVSGMMPGDGAIDQQLPLLLSWIPGNNTVNYDLYIWDSTAAEPAVPYASNIGNVSYTLPANAPLPYNRTYKWRIVAKNPCTTTAGPVQHFKLIPLPDLVVSDVQVPASATSGQTISVSWKVTNIGPGRTLPDQYWRDGIYFALDTIPNVSFHGSPNWNASSWSSLTANGRPLLLGYKDRPSALDSGQFYTNSIDFTLPLGYNFPVYVYVLSPNNHPNGPLLQASVLNDTARAPHQIVITQAPTPDLRVDSVFVPTSTFSGSTINLTYKVKNYGVVTPAGQNWTDSVFISQSPLFDRNQCIPINVPKYNDSYYPNARKASIYNSEQLNANATITKNLEVVIPNYIFGTWFIYVKTNANTANGGFVYEGALNGNNLGQAQMEIYLTPTPRLTVQNLTVPVTSASTTQPIGVNWSIKNEGFRDNIERNRGHYLTMSTCHVSCGPSAPAGSVCIAPSVIKDSIVFGGSYWIDRVYLSTDATGLNVNNAILVKETKHGTLNSGVYIDPSNPPGSFVSCPAIAGGNINVTNVIHSGSEFPKSEGFNIPSDLAPGNYYIYVYTNPTKTVWEYPGTPQISRSALPITVQRPDATVSAISAPPVAAGGQTIAVSYSVLNVGSGAVFNHQRKDQLYISNFSNFDGSAQLVATQTFTENLPAGVAVPHNFSYTIPPATTGNKYFYVVTNYDSLFRETNMNNNTSVSAVSSITAALPADLIVSSVQPKDSVMMIFPTTFKYTVTNNGTGATTGYWTDSVYFSCSPAFNASATLIASRVQNRILAAGESYTDSFALVVPKMSYEANSCFPQQMYAPGYFFVRTNANNGTYEGSAVNNNIGNSGSRVVINPLVDHELVSVFSSRDTVTVGVPFSASWKIKNLGYKPVPDVRYYYSYYDGVFFSPDSIVNENDIQANYFLKYNILNRNDSMVDTRSIMPPNIATGDYYMIAKTNYNNGINAEKILTNNYNFVRDASGAARKIHVIRPLLPDLVDTIITAPATVAAGQPITIVYKITNTGVGVTFPGGWKNEVLLSADFSAAPNQGDRLLATRTRTSPLLPGESYFDTVTVTIPSFMAAGNYVLISEANSNNAVTELNNSNNLGFHLLEVFRPDSTDLIVSSVMKPDTVYLGEMMSNLKWVVRNNSGADAVGWLTDGVYLTANDLWDSTATLLGTRYRHINLDPNEQDTAMLSPYVMGVTEGSYNVVVKTDLLSNILEYDKDNNEGVSITPVYVKVKKIYLDIPEITSLQSRDKFYRLDIPDSLIGSTILVTLKTPDSLLVKNELFIGSGFVPSPAHYDYRFEIPNYGNQQIVMSDVTQSTYYIMVRCVTPNAAAQNITLKAVKLPFAILNVHTNSGGNIGNVTVRIRGSLFRDSMIAKLSNGTTTIYASAIYYTNSTQVFATFNLQGRPLGVYDVTLIKPDSTEAVLPNGFTITNANNGGLITGGGVNTGAGDGNEPGCDPGAASGLNSQLVIEMLVPERVLLDRPIVIVINYHNPTNFDIPAQTRTLYSEEGIKMAFTKAGVPTGTTTLQLELFEQGGPPGIIRAGGSGTILVYTRAPKKIPVDGPVILFKLK